MPNWCSNYVTIVHDDIQKMNELLFVIERAKQAKEHAEGFFQQIVPMPAELLDDDLTTYGGSEEEQATRTVKQKAMIKKYGYPSWYDWRIEKWGTKWDVREFGFENFDTADHKLDINFETAWSPPLAIYEALKEQGYYVRAEYVDEGMGFVGEWVDGNDFCYGRKEDLPDHLSHLWPTYDEEGELV